MKRLILFVFLLWGVAAAAQPPREVLLVGTLRKVSPSAKNAYRFLLKRVTEYRPQAIYVERPMPHDDASWEYLKEGWSPAYTYFYQVSDSLRRLPPICSHERAGQILAQGYRRITPAQLDTLITYFARERDYADADLYRYVQEYGLKGSPKPRGNEYEDLAYKLALRFGIMELYGIDDHSVTARYYKALQAAREEGETNGNNEALRALDRDATRQGTLSYLFGRYAAHVNTPEARTFAEQVNSFRGAPVRTPAAEAVGAAWDERNRRMAAHIGEAVTALPYQRSVVLVGAGHVEALRAALQRDYPEIAVSVLDE